MASALTGLRHAAAERARVQVERGPVDDDLDVREAAQADAQRRDAAPEHGRVAHAHEVGREVRGVLAHEDVEVRAADLLLALDDHA